MICSLIIRGSKKAAPTGRPFDYSLAQTDGFYADSECIALEESTLVGIFADARRITSSSAGANSSGGIPPTATNPGSSPRAIEIWFQRRNGEVVGRTIIRRFGSGKAK